MARVNDAVVERLERVIEALQDNSIKMGQMLAVHDEKLDKQDRIDAVLFEKVESLHREVNRQHRKLKMDAKGIYEKLMTVLESWKRKCGLFLVALLLYLSWLVQSDKK